MDGNVCEERCVVGRKQRCSHLLMFEPRMDLPQTPCAPTLANNFPLFFGELLRKESPFLYTQTAY
jgi:hypothetical protein